MRIGVRPRGRHAGWERFKGRGRGTRGPLSGALLPGLRDGLRLNRFATRTGQLTGLEDSSAAHPRRLPTQCVAGTTPAAQECQPASLSIGGCENTTHQNGLTLSLRTGSLASNCCSRETFLLFGRTRSHCTNCY